PASWTVTVVGSRVVVPRVRDTRAPTDAAEVDLVRARVVRDVAGVAGPVDEVGDSLRPRDDRVGDPRAGRARDDMPCAQLVILPLGPALGCDGRRPELQRAAALEHDVRLGLERVDVRHDAALAAIALNPVEARALRAGGRG